MGGIGFPKKALPLTFALAIPALIAGCGATAANVSAASHSPGATVGFGDAYSRWQLQVPQQSFPEVMFTSGLLLVSEVSEVSEPDGSLVHVTAYHEDTGTKAWSRDFAQIPLAAGTAGSVLVAGTDSASLTAYRSPAETMPCPQAITRINPATGTSVWTSQVSASDCGTLTASASYVVDGTTILNASNGVTLRQLPADGTAVAQAWAFGSDILVQDGSVLQLDALQNGRLMTKWHLDVSTYTVLPDYPQITLAASPADGGPVRYEVVNPATGTITGFVMATAVFATPGGVTAVSPGGQLLFLSGSVLKTGPKLSAGISYSGGMLWQYQPPNGSNTGPVDAIAIAPRSFKTLGRLVTTQSQASAEGDDPYVVSDGSYAAIAAAQVIYVFRL